jgi:hypothetical protein
MPERDSYSPGVPCWVDLSTPDIDGAVAFYSSLFGWDIAESEPNTGGYRLAMLGGRPVAGLMPHMSEGQPTVWTTYVATDDADATAERVTANGGQVMAGPMDVMDLGRMGVFLDPTGAAFGTWQPNQFAGAGVVGDPGSFIWNELQTRDMAAEQSFYPAVLGWEVEERPFGGRTYTIWKAGGEQIGGGMQMDANFPPEVPSHWLIYFGAQSADDGAAKVSELGGTVMVPPDDIPDMGRFAVVTDPQGATFAFFQPTG